MLYQGLAGRGRESAVEGIVQEDEIPDQSVHSQGRIYRDAAGTGV